MSRARSVLEIATQAGVAALARGARAKPRHLEAVEQRLFVKRWRLDPRTRDLPACAIPNGGKRGKVEAALLKAEGVEAGAPDWLCFASGRDNAVGLALEFKSPDGSGRVSTVQAVWHERLRAAGWRVAVVTSATEAWAAVVAHLDLRAAGESRAAQQTRDHTMRVAMETADV